MGRRSKVAALPKQIREWLEQQLVAGDFSGYDGIVAELNALLEKQGSPERVSRSSVHRHGSALERRLAAVKASTEAARQIAQAAPDSADERSAAVMSLVQTDLFNTLLLLQEANEADNPVLRLKLLASAGKSIAELSRSAVNQKRWAVENEARIREDERQRVAKEAVAAAKAGGASADLQKLMRETLGV
jgi:hypothetical protein